ncbi:MAG: redoxin domain-containing protein [Ignavibacteriaceae bacterium]|nr:redoxin domain-containing protein [Ignavibacteriaceae bacterium]
MRNLIMAILTLFIAGSLTAQSNVTLKGKIVDPQGNPVKRADIVVYDFNESYESTYASITTFDGNFDINFGRNGQFSMMIYAAGYKPLDMTIPLYNYNGTAEIEFRMKSIWFDNEGLILVNASTAFEYISSAPMTVKPDGSLSYKFTKNYDSIYIAFTSPGFYTAIPAINKKTELSYDGFGSYYNVLRNVKANDEFVVNKNDFPVYLFPDYSSINIISDATGIGLLLQLIDEQNLAYFKGNKLWYNELVNKLNSTNDEKMKDIIRFKLFELFYTEVIPPGELKKVTSGISPSNPLWISNIYNLRSYLSVAQIDNTFDYLFTVLKNLKIDYSMYEVLMLAKELNDKVSAEQYQVMYDYAAPKMEGSEYLDMLNENYDDGSGENTSTLGIGSKIPEFSVTDEQSGVTFTNADIKAKYTLIDFWATWCMPCVDEIPELEKVYKNYKDKGFEIYSISMSESSKDVENFRAKRFPMPWKHIVPADQGEQIATVFEVFYIPRMLLVDANGNIIGTEEILRGGGLEKALAELLD